MVQKRINKSMIELVEGDITEQDTDVIVNAANPSLLGGGGVDGAIHRAGGPDILAECRTLGVCEIGEAKITTAGKLKAKYVIHTVGPVYRDGRRGEPEKLALCHRRSLALALEHGAKSVAFPAISTGVYGYPVDEAANVAIKSTVEFLMGHPGIELVRFVLYRSEVYQAFADTLVEVHED